jgi:hypothetical protein
MAVCADVAGCHATLSAFLLHVIALKKCRFSLICRVRSPLTALLAGDHDEHNRVGNAAYSQSASTCPRSEGEIARRQRSGRP